VRRRTLVALALLLAPASGEAHKPTTTKFTFYRDVYPIFRAKCGACHQKGGVAPMSLLDYREAYPWAVAIKNEVLELSMPPWFADERHGKFRSRSLLAAGEMNTIVDWCLGGTPEGNANDASMAAVLPDEAAFQEPDLVLDLPAPFVLAADRAEASHEVRLRPRPSRDRSLSAIEFRPGNPRIVRSVLIYGVPDGAEAEPAGLIASWIPGEHRLEYPAGRAVPLPARSSLLVRIHYKKTWLDEGKEVSDRSAVALFFARGKAVEPIRSFAVETSGVGSLAARDGGFEKTVSRTLPGAVEILSLLPRVEAPLHSFFAVAVLPDGARRSLIRLREPDPAWPRAFWLEEPLSLPKGARIELTLSGEGAALDGHHYLHMSVVAKR
jgi:hypothetical protein